MTRLVAAVIAAFLSLLPVYAQKDAAPPDILQISRDPVKPGKLAEYSKVETRAAEACYKAGIWPYFAVQSITGPKETWFVSGFETYDAMENSSEPFYRNPEVGSELGRLMEAKATLVSEPTTIFLRYREDLGRNSGLVRPGTRYLTVTWTRVIPGHASEFEDSQRTIRSVRERAGASDNRVVYQVTSGIPSNLYLTFSPFHTFHDAAQSLDGLLDHDDLDDGTRGKLRELTSDSVASTETFIFVFSPEMSNPAGEWVADDPEFWKSSPPLQRHAAPAPPKPGH
ncbi:MAG: hypothetical protein ACRD4F_02150 [Candidatus Angelobacter sp.]